MKIRSLPVIAAWLLIGHAATTTAQQRSVDIASLQQAAVDTDPRLQQLQLLSAQTELRLRNIAAWRRPSVTVDGQAQYQSDVPRPAFTLPGGSLLFTAPKATYDSGLRIEQRIFDASIRPRS